MGMDIHGLNPKENKTYDDFPTLEKMNKIKPSERIEILAKDNELNDKYWKEKDEFDRANPGVYFRNSAWNWRPLWDFCYNFTDGIISEDLHQSGHYNDGAGLNAEDAEKLGKKLMELIGTGVAIEHEIAYKKTMEQRKKADKNDATTFYPFDTMNVEDFAHFCIESGGFEIW